MKILTRLIVLFMPIIPKFFVRFVSKRYVAGETLEDAVKCIRELNAEGAMATLDILGEENYQKEKVEACIAEYEKVFDVIAKENLDANVSVKPTMLGMKISDEYCAESHARISEAAKKCNNSFFRIDMEDNTTTDQTIKLYNDMLENGSNTGIVFQTYMHRTLADIGDLPEKANVRLCKGIYIEPRKIAWKPYETVRHNFLAGLEKLFKQGAYVAIATHDEHLICGAMALIDKYNLTPDRYEFQMLLGVQENMRRTIISEGHRMRVYVPYGKDWYPYSTRRLRENPDMAKHIIRRFFGFDK